jgi:hypothetical protein
LLLVVRGDNQVAAFGDEPHGQSTRASRGLVDMCRNRASRSVGVMAPSRGILEEPTETEVEHNILVDSQEQRGHWPIYCHGRDHNHAAAHQAIKTSLLGTADATPRPGADS